MSPHFIEKIFKKIYEPERYNKCEDKNNNFSIHGGLLWGPPDSPTAHQSDSSLVRQPINARGMPSLINILQGIPTDHEGGSYIHVPYITTSSIHDNSPVFLRVTPVMNLPKCDQAQASDQFLATNKEICLKTPKIYKSKMYFYRFLATNNKYISVIAHSTH